MLIMPKIHKAQIFYYNRVLNSPLYLGPHNLMFKLHHEVAKAIELSRTLGKHFSLKERIYKSSYDKRASQVTSTMTGWKIY